MLIAAEYKDKRCPYIMLCLSRDQDRYRVLSPHRYLINTNNRQHLQHLQASPVPSSAGNVTVFFPNFEIDGVTAACHSDANSTYGGFLVQFDTEFGDLPLLVSSVSSNVTITEFRAGNSVS